MTGFVVCRSLVFGLALTVLPATQAQAQVAASVTVATNQIFRGESITDDDPAASMALDFDHASGVYAGASVSLSAGSHDPRVVSSNQSLGYAVRRGTTALEFGVIHRNYHRHALADEAFSPDYFEGYIGVSHRNIRMRIYVSPDYHRDGGTTYYGEVNARLATWGKWSLSGRGGLSVVPTDVAGNGMRIYPDWSVQAHRSVGSLSLGLGAAGTTYPVFGTDQGSKVFASIGYTF